MMVLGASVVLLGCPLLVLVCASKRRPGIVRRLGAASKTQSSVEEKATSKSEPLPVTGVKKTELPDPAFKTTPNPKPRRRNKAPPLVAEEMTKEKSREALELADEEKKKGKSMEALELGSAGMPYGRYTVPDRDPAPYVPPLTSEQRRLGARVERLIGDQATAQQRARVAEIRAGAQRPAQDPNYHTLADLHADDLLPLDLHPPLRPTVNISPPDQYFVAKYPVPV